MMFIQPARRHEPSVPCSRRQWLSTASTLAAAVCLPRPTRAQELAPAQAAAADGDDAATPAADAAPLLTYDSPKSQTWRVGLILRSNRASCSAVQATFPIFANWPEQSVQLVDQHVDRHVTAWTTRTIGRGVRQVQLVMPFVPPGNEVEVTFTFQVQRSRILGPEDTSGLQIPPRLTAETRSGMGNSPYIDASDARIKAAARQLAEQPADSDWQRVEQIYDWVREQVRYTEGPIRSASQALRDGTGDCEELSSLFIAICRASRIPARIVWIPGHCYPEFYLEDQQERGAWFPCQAAGTRQFGQMDEYRPVLQKGDRFKVPEKRLPQRYVSEFFTCKTKGGDPTPTFVRDQLDG